MASTLTFSKLDYIYNKVLNKMENTLITQQTTTTIITNEEFNQHWEKWKNFAHKNALRLSLINQYDHWMRKELIQVARIALMDAILSGKNNGKKGNDYNGLIRLYISGRQQKFVDEIVPVIKTPIRWRYDEKFENDNQAYIPKYYSEDYAHQIVDDQYIDEVLEKHKIIIKVLDKQPVNHKEMYLHHFGLFNREKLTYPQISKKYGYYVNGLPKLIKNLTQQIKDEYTKYIQSIT